MTQDRGDAAGAARAGASLREVEPASAVSSQAAIPIAELPPMPAAEAMSLLRFSLAGLIGSIRGTLAFLTSDQAGLRQRLTLDAKEAEAVLDKTRAALRAAHVAKESRS
jgi:hypothetical protein